MSSLADRLRQALSRADMSQAELARRCKVKQPSVHGWLSGKSKFLRGENLLSAAAALGVSEQWLATGGGAMTADDVAQGAGDAPPTPSAALGDLHAAVLMLATALAGSIPDAGRKLLAALEAVPAAERHGTLLEILHDSVAESLPSVPAGRTANPRAREPSARKRA